MKLRILSLLCVFSLLLPALLACGGPKDPTPVESTGDPTPGSDPVSSVTPTPTPSPTPTPTPTPSATFSHVQAAAEMLNEMYEKYWVGSVSSGHFIWA